MKFHDLPPAEFEGWKTLLDGERDAMYTLSQGRRQAVDLGTFRGLSAAIFAHACERVHTVDLYEQLTSGEFPALNGHSLENTRRLIEKFPNITCEQSDTVDAAFHWDGGPVDVLFVDASHSRDGTLLNTLAWLRHMPPGAIVIFHDDNEIHPGVQEALRLLQRDNRLRFFPPGKEGETGSLAVCEVVL